jgi:hypothetical protein
MKVMALWPAWLAGVLGLVVVLELSMPAPETGADVPMSAGLAVTAASPALAAVDAGAWQDNILARPIFRPDCRQLSATPDSDGAMPRLTAIVITALGGSAIFADDDGKPIILAAGGDLNVFKLFTIVPDSVVLAGPAGRTVLHPEFVNASDPSNANDLGIITLPPRHFLDNQ